MSLFRLDELGKVLAPGLASTLANGAKRFSPTTNGGLQRRGREAFASLLSYDAETYLPDDVLTKVDRMSMLNTLEVRVPLLDQQIVEFSARLPFSMKMHRGVTKWVLREAAKNLLPEPVLHRRKRGFGVPLHRWMDRGLLALARDTLLDEPCARRGWLNREGLESFLTAGSPHPGRRAHQVFALTCLELWARAFLDRARGEIASPMDGTLDLHPAVAGSLSH